MSDSPPYSPGARRAPRGGPMRTLIAIAIVIVAAVLIAALLTFCAKQTGTSGAGGGRGGRGGFGGGGAGGRPAITVGVARLWPGTFRSR
jgi:hypothetical protein